MKATKLVVIRSLIILAGTSIFYYWVVNGGKFVPLASNFKLVTSGVIGLAFALLLEIYLHYWHEDKAVEFYCKYIRLGNTDAGREAYYQYKNHTKHLSAHGIRNVAERASALIGI
ncbi:MAG: hypothetical protein WC831_00625 [Parcubacteria group bacterium]|jgi:hypothetical protein